MLQQVEQTWCFFLLLAVPRTFGIDFSYGKLTILSNAMTILVRLGAWSSAEHVSTACVVALCMLGAYWFMLPFPSSSDLYPKLYSGLWNPRNLFIHAALPLDSVLVAYTRREMAFSSIRPSLLLTGLVTLTHGVVSSFMQPPPYEYQESLSLPAKLVGSLGLVIVSVVLQYALHHSGSIAGRLRRMISPYCAPLEMAEAAQT